MSRENTTETSFSLDRDTVVVGSVVVLGMVLAVLDATIVNVAIPTLGRELGASISSIQWVMTGYLLAFASVIPLSPWLSARFGTRQVWVAALTLFLAGSAFAAAAWSIDALIAFRLVQGVGGGLIMPVGQTILAQAAGPRRIGRVMSVLGVPMLLAPIFGPVIGGALVDAGSWRWIFLVNVPVGLAAIVLARRMLPDSEPRPGDRLDLPGLALLSPGVAVLVYGLSEAGAGGGLGDVRALVGVFVGLLLVGLYVRHALPLGRGALIDVSLFARRGFGAAAATNFLVGIALFGALILLPLYFQLVRGESALATGLLLAPQGVGAALAMPVAGWLTDRIGARSVIVTGIVLASLGTAGYTQVGGDTAYGLLAADLFVIGLGLGATIVPSMSVAYQSVPRESLAQAAGTINVVQRLAGSIGTALLAVVLQRSIASGLPALDGGIDTISTLPAAVRAGSAGELADAFGTAFWVAFGLVVASVVPALMLPRRPALLVHGSAPLARSPGGA